ncbi:MAG TPA: isocitrate lyase/phosphoenolpyruvate mutase family protein [Pyrinomonadaceae bacterium]|jgi:2-methylisocitrate lyase-like PEP mutase family enzyme|nr:isocitrate lyase/phosphoenolpyruvate mutase family protein [Pyrinomonadaceae bacterium]
MTNQKQLAQAFTDLHIKGDPVIIFNIWDAGTAKAAQDIGAKALATGSWAVAAANGFADGEIIPLDLVIANLERITAGVDVPVSLDFEGGYAVEPDELRKNIERVIAAGAIGINFEDRIVTGEGLYSIEKQAARIRALREAANEADVPLFINARSDVVLPLDRATHTEAHSQELIERAKAYAEAGASGFFAPGLANPDFIGRQCEASALPVNILVMPGVPSSKELADLGVARISYGGGSYRTTMEAFKEAGRKALSYASAASTP